MVYFDNAATTFPKPAAVREAVVNALKNSGANPGRSGHKLSIKASEEIYNARKNIADFFNVGDIENVIFTANCTHSLNIVIKGYLKRGDHAVVSCLEHNSVIRPLTELSSIGVTFTVANVYPGDDEKTLASFRNSLNEKTKLVICTHASNVWGITLPVFRIAAMCRQYGIKTAVDAAQTAGIIPIDFDGSLIDFICCPGHKGLYGPMGTGLLLLKDAKNLSPLILGGTGSSSISGMQPDTLPDKFESGTPNLPGIAGLSAGVSFVRQNKSEKIAAHEYKIILSVYDRLAKTDGVKLYTARPDTKFYAPVLSFNIKGFDSENVSTLLSSKYNIATRAGLHCSPSAHSFMSTLNEGAVRVSPSFFNKPQDSELLASAVKNISARGGAS